MIAYHHLFFVSAFMGYLLAGLCFIVFFLTQKRKIGVTGFFLALIGFLAHSLALIIRSCVLKYPAISNLYESLSFFAWAITLVYIVTEYKRKVSSQAAFIFLWVILMMGIAVVSDSRIKPLAPALRSYWLGIHASLCFLSYAFFTLAFSFGIMYLWQDKEVKSRRIDNFFFRLPSLGLLDRLGYRSVTLGFLSLSLGIITGSIWAKQAWGSFWNWDPKETWSLVIWLFYVVYLHSRLNRGWIGRRSAYLAITGFLIILFTYFGVSLLLPGLHAYL